MAARAGTAYIDVQPDLTALNRKLNAAMSRSRLGKIGMAGGAVLGAGLAAGFAGTKILFDIGDQFDQATDRIRAGTGATGRALRALRRDFDRVVMGVPTDFGSASTAITNLNRRLDLTGKPLRRLSKQMLELSRITGESLDRNIPAVTRLFGDWSIATDRQAGTLDKLFRISQATGIEVGGLSELMVQFGSPLRQLGLDFDFSAAMFARFEKEGVNIQTVLPGLRFALRTFAKEGRDPARGLQETFDKIEQLGRGAEATQLAFRIFGARAGADIAAAVQEGRFELDKYLSTMRRGRDTILRAGKDTQDFSERWLMFKNKVLVGLAPLADRVFRTVGRAMGEIDRIMGNKTLTGDEKFRRIFDVIAQEAGQAFGEVVEAAGNAAPKIVGALAVGMATAWTDMNPLGKLFTVGALVAAVGGRGAIVASGAALGRLLGGGIVAGAATGVGGGVAGGAAGGIAGGAAAGGIMASMRAGLMVAAKRAGWIGVGLTVADGVMKEVGDQVKERSAVLRDALEGSANRTFGERLPSLSKGTSLVPVSFGPKNPFGDDARSGAGKALLALYDQMRTKRVQMNAAQLAEIQTKARSLDLDRAARAELDRMVALLREGSRLRIGVDLGDVGKDRQLAAVRRNLAFLRSGTGSSMADILKVSRRNMNLIEATWGQGTRRTRELAARNMRGTAEAIRLQMQRSGNFTRAGLERMEALIRNAKLVDPTRRQAQGFGHAWADGFANARKVTQRGIDGMIAEARKMPGPMRRSALEAFGVVIRAARDSGRLTQAEYRRLRSRIGAEWVGIKTDGTTAASRMAASMIGSFVGVANRTADAFGSIGGNVNSMLRAFGHAKPLTFDLRKIRAQTKQTGGVIVPGQGTGDKVHALLEPGEVVWNRKAVAAIGGPEQANRINQLIPRFQTGGIVGRSFNVDGAKPGFVPFMNYLNNLFGPLYVMSGLRPGSITTSGSVSNHASGSAVDISTMQNGLNQAFDSASLNATGAAAARMDALYTHMGRYIPPSHVPGDFLWRTDTGGNHWNHIHRGITSALADNPAAMAAFLAKLPEGAGFGALQRLLLAGPDGPLRDLGQGAIDKVYKAANEYIAAASAVPTFGTGSLVSSPHTAGGWATRPQIESVWRSEGGPASGQTIASAIAMRESRGNPNAENVNTDGSIDRGWFQINSEAWGPLSVFGGPENAGNAVQISQHGTDWSAWNLNGDWRNGLQLQLGGIVQALQDGGIARGIRQLGRFTRKPLAGRRARAMIRKTLALVGGIGLPAADQSKLTDLSNSADTYAEFASRAGSLSYQMLDERGEPIVDAERRPMTFFADVNGRNEAGWTNERLGALFDLRNRLVGSVDVVRGEQDRVARLIDATRRRIAEIQREIDAAARRRRRLQKDIAEAQQLVRRTRAQLDDAKEQLGELMDNPRRHAGRISTLRSRIAHYVGVITSNEDAIGRWRQSDQILGVAQKRRADARDRLTTVLGRDDSSGLLGRAASMREFVPELLGSDGGSFKGLVTVQGLGGPTGVLASLPEIGVLGGEIFDSQDLLRQLGVKPDPVPAPGTVGSESDSERVSLLEDELRKFQQRAFVANQQFAVLRDFPPYGGSFDRGGVVPGPPGAARTIIAHGGEIVVPPGAGMTSNIRVVIEDHRTRVFDGDREIRAIVRDETRKMSRGGRHSGRAGGLVR